jgi:aspartate aminotransferase
MSKLTLSDRLLQMEPSATLKMAQAARDLAARGVDVMTLSAGEPDFDTPKAICDQAKAAMDAGLTHYAPVHGNQNILAAIQEKFARDQKVTYAKDEVLCTAGAKSAILYALEAIVNQGDEVIIFAPFWVSYKEQIKLAGGVPVIVSCGPKDGFMPTAAMLKQAITSKTKAIILNSPNNPSGAVISQQGLSELCQVVSGTNIWVISDEIYERILFDHHKHFSPAAESDDLRERTIVVSGLSKAYAMTGWRVGVVGGNKTIITAIGKLQGQSTTCLPEFIMEAAAFALREPPVVLDSIKTMIKAYTERREVAVARLQAIPKLSVFIPQGAFYVWVDCREYLANGQNSHGIKDDLELSLRLLSEAHVACVAGTPFGSPGYLRLSIASPMDNIVKAIDRMSVWLS